MEKLFKADWKLEEFKNLIEAGLKMGSKYFFLVGCAHGLYFMVRDTDSEGLDSNPKRFPNEVYEVFAGVEWGSEKVLEQTLCHLEGLRASLETLPLWYDMTVWKTYVF